MSTDLLVIVDDNSGAFLYSNTEPIAWGMVTSTSWYGTAIHISGDGAVFTFTFNGISAAIIGITPLFPHMATVQIDNGTSSSFTIDLGPEPDYYKQWFMTPTLPDGRHTITIRGVSGISIDYAVVKVGAQTPLTRQTVIVDDDSSLIQYSGRWSRSTSSLTLEPNFTGYPYGNGTHRSSNPGDTFTFRFSGTSIAVYGVFSWRNIGSLTATYSIAGVSHTATGSVNTSSPRYLIGTGEVPNYLYFSLDNLASGPHTLMVNITEMNNHTFMLDYITYEPAFDTLSSMPSLSSGNSSTAAPSSSTANASRRSVSTGAIVGIALGGLVFGVLTTILVVLFILHRRRAREQDRAYPDAAQDYVYPDAAQSYAYPDAALGSGENDPNLLSVSNSPLLFIPLILFSGPSSSQMQKPLPPRPVIGGLSPPNVS